MANVVLPPWAGGGETLPHAVARMRAQGFSDAQIAGQVQKWHPGWTPTQITAKTGILTGGKKQPPESDVRALPSGASVTTFKGNPNQPIRRYAPAYPGERPSGFEPAPHGRAVRPYYQVPVDKRTGVEQSVDTWLSQNPEVTHAQRWASPWLTVPATVAGDVLANLGGGPSLLAAVHAVQQHKPLQAGVELAGILPFGRLGKVVRGAEEGVQAARGAEGVYQGSRASEIESLINETPTPTGKIKGHAPNVSGREAAANGGGNGKPPSLPPTANGGIPPLGPGGKPVPPHLTPEAGLLREALKGAPSVRGTQAAGFSAQRGSRFAKAEAIYRDASLTPEERQARVSAVLRGQLDRPTFTGFKQMTPDVVTNLKSQIMEHATLKTGQKTTLLRSLDAAIGGKVPTEGEHKLFEQTFGKDTALGINKAAKTGLWKNVATNVINTPRTLQSTLDMSALLRQGAVALGRHPIITGRNIVPLVKAFGSEQYAQDVERAIADHPNFPLAQKANVALTGSGALAKHEEQFTANLLENLGGNKNPIHWSSRSYSAFLNKTRMDIFNHLLGVAQSQGRNIHDEQFLKELGELVNVYTGRGNLGRAERAANVFNGLFFSPRLAKSRIDILRQPFNPMLARRNPFVYKQYVRAAAQTFGAMILVLELARLNGAKVGLNPESADFGKMKFGNTRVDLGAGFLQFFHLGGQLLSGKSVSTTSGKVSHIYSGKPYQTSGWDILTNFGVGKLSPPFAMAHDVLAQQTNHGKFNVWQELISHLTPLSAQDIYGVATDHSQGHPPLASVPGLGLFSILGGGLQTYGPKPTVGPTIVPFPGFSGSSTTPSSVSTQPAGVTLPPWAR